METKCGCGSSQAIRLLFACSGAADVGEISDRAARQLTRQGDGRIYCLAGIGGRVETIMETTRGAGEIVAIDGCTADCVKKILEAAGFTPTTHLRVTDLGLEKGKSPATEENVARVADRVKVGR